MNSTTPNHIVEELQQPPNLQWDFEFPPPPRNPRDLHEKHTSYLGSALSQEVIDHNNTRCRLQQHLTLSMNFERGQAYERAHVEYLNIIIRDLKAQIQEEKNKRKETEDANAALLQREMENFCSVSWIHRTKKTQLIDFEVDPVFVPQGYPTPPQSEAPSTGARTPGDNTHWRLSMLADVVVGDHPEITEYFNMQTAELEATSGGEGEQEGGLDSKKRKLCHI